MKYFIICFALFSSYCYCERLLGGWSTSENESLNREWLDKALYKIHDGEVTDDIKSQVSDLVCKQQVVNGLNIKCTFALNGKTWLCSYYKSFIGTQDTQLDECNVKDEEASEEKKDSKETGENNEEQEFEELRVSNDDENEEKIITMNQNEDEQDLTTLNENDDEEKPTEINQSENKEKPATLYEEDDEEKIELMNENVEKSAALGEENDMERPPTENADEEDDEAKIDAIYNKISEKYSNSETEDDE
ncbi:unnamed protein product [Rotaria socialis]|uniref:Uncharacterized protein n=1 Tax=Rotaria socialis TaxID=392032 RepID=A0A818VF53_9BILA|nr:unnamed protein product [Rotaria socialis]CAF4464593.1 unnamed protein product [Rotaria socialis]